jgi:hypothetical protein
MKVTVSKLTSGQVIPNPTGRGGFREHPENRSPGGLWNPEMTFSFQYKKFNNMPVDDFKDWKERNPKRTMVQELAWGAVYKARTEHKYLQEISNRTEGMPKQATDITSGGEKIDGLVTYRPERKE